MKRQTERERFEAALHAAHCGWRLMRTADGNGYVEDWVDGAWHGWKLAVAAAKRDERRKRK